MNTYQQLRSYLRSDCPLIIPDAYDALSARLIERAGFKAVQCSGYSMALACGSEGEVNLGLKRNLQITGEIVRSVGIPVMADGEDGFGSPETTGQTVRSYIETGVAGMNIEDQDLQNSQVGRLVATEQMVEKIRAARNVAAECGVPEFVINGRSDALAVAADRHSGLAEAIERCCRYLDAGADLAFVTAVTTLEEVQTLVKEIPGPVSVAIGLPYNLQTLSIANLRDTGVARISLPAIAVFSAIRAMKQALRSIIDDESFQHLQQMNILCQPKDLADLANG